MSGRNEYYSHREMSTRTPSLYLSFIHDAMDHAKTYVPRLSDKLKSLMGHVTPLPLKLRDYETYFIGDCTRDLAFNTTPVHPLFAALLDGDVFKTTVLEKKGLSREEYFDLQQQQDIGEGRRLRMLPPNLYIQLDNSAKDNKNWTVMAFCSELVAIGCCKTITMSFLVVGHTHEDVDAFFSKVNVAQAGKSIESLPHFLEVVHNAQSSKAYPRLIHEVADYKRHVAHYIVKIEGQSAPVAFKFWIRDNIPVYQVKEIYGGKWVPEHGRTLWKRQDPESPTNFNVQLPPDQNPKLNEMIAPYAKKVEYWKNVADVVQAGWRSNDESELQEAFWPITDYGTGHQVPSQTSTDPSSMGNTRREVEEELQARDEIFVGEAAARSLATFVPIIDIVAGLMLLLRPSDDFKCQDCLWVAKATGPVCRDESEPNFNKIPIQWWRPKHGSRKASIIDRSLHSLQHEVQDDPESEVPLSSGDDDDDEEFIGETPPPPEYRESQPEFEPAKKKRHYNSSVRNPPDPLRRARSNAKKKVQRETTEEKIRGIQRTTCCGELCCRKVSYEVIRQCRLEYFGLPHDDKEEYIHTHLHMRHQSAIDEGKHIIDQKLICKRAFWTIYGFSKTKYYKMIAQSADGIVIGYHGNKGRLKPKATTFEAHALLKQLLQQLAEPMPHMQCTLADGSTDIVQMLPSCYTRKSIMRELNAKIASIGGSGISKSLFYASWASDYKNYKIHKRGVFAKCDTCIKLKLQLMEERRPDFRRPIEEERNEHMREQMSRRSVYYAKQALAKAQPERYLCIIHDKMDQAKTNIPRLADNMKRLHIG
ncbi:hypothetical protein R1sor_012977 [Riccia sorocarpa]|uniref:DUF7869 domain-containing protein n=1 Tax=Riccia sorocarpa TaxID=122646 RepID=A0ABD3I5W1_9MARC